MKSSALSRGIQRAREVRCQPYWDTVIPGASAADQTFFSTVQTTNPRLGNMQTAGQLPAPRQFLIKGISVYVVHTVAATSLTTALLDVITVSRSLFSLFISDKEYLRLCGWMAPGAGGVETAAQATTGAATAAHSKNGQALHYNYFHMNPEILIPQQQNFKVTMTNLPAALIVGTEVTVVLWGTEQRAVQ